MQNVKTGEQGMPLLNCFHSTLQPMGYGPGDSLKALGDVLHVSINEHERGSKGTNY